MCRVNAVLEDDMFLKTHTKKPTAFYDSGFRVRRYDTLTDIDNFTFTSSASSGLSFEHLVMNDFGYSMLLAVADIGKHFITCCCCCIIVMAALGLETNLSHKTFPDRAV